MDGLTDDAVPGDPESSTGENLHQFAPVFGRSSYVRDRCRGFHGRYGCGLDQFVAQNVAFKDPF